MVLLPTNGHRTFAVQTKLTLYQLSQSLVTIMMVLNTCDLAAQMS